MKFIVDFFLNPLSLWWALILVSALFWRFAKIKMSILFGIAAFVWLFVISISPVPQWLIYHLENKYPPLNALSIPRTSPAHILVLGGGHTIAPDLPATGQLTSSALSRLSEGLRIARQLNDDVLICSGYSSTGRIPQAEVLRNAALELGAAWPDIETIDTPGNTKEEAQAYFERYPSHPNVILVTSASHMKRALLYFEKIGLKPLPAPTDQYIKLDPLKNPFDFYPSARKIQMMEVVFHEYAGLIKFYIFET